MAWSRLQSASVSAGGTNPAVAYSTANLTAGTKLIAAASLSTSSAVSVSTTCVVTDGASNTMTFIGGVYEGTNNFLGLYAMDTPAGDAGTKPTITATFNAGLGNFGASLIIQEVSGLAAGNTLAAMIDGTAAVNDAFSGGPATGAAYSTGAASEYLVALYGDAGTAFTYSNPPSGYTADANNLIGSTNAGLAVEYKNSGGTSETVSFTLGGTASWCTILAAFKLGSASGPSAAFPNLMMWRTERVSRASGRMIRQ